MKFMQNMVIMIKLRSNNRCINNNTCLYSKKNGAYFHSNIQKKELAKMRRCIFTICDKLLFSHLQCTMVLHSARQFHQISQIR